MFFRILLLLAALPLTTAAYGQTSDAPFEDPVAAIKALREGTLLVRLPSSQRKIAALEESLAKEETGTARAKWLRKELEATRSETQSFNENMHQAFREAYGFSDLRFTYDYATPELKAGRFKGNLLDEDLEPSAEVEMGELPVFILSFGRTSKEYSDGVEAMVILGEQLKSPPPPFPYYQRLNDFKAFWGSIFPRPDQEIYDALRLVGKLNEKLEKFYNKNTAGANAG